MVLFLSFCIERLKGFLSCTLLRGFIDVGELGLCLVAFFALLYFALRGSGAGLMSFMLWDTSTNYRTGGKRYVRFRFIDSLLS